LKVLELIYGIYIFVAHFLFYDLRDTVLGEISSGKATIIITTPTATEKPRVFEAPTCEADTFQDASDSTVPLLWQATSLLCVHDSQSAGGSKGRNPRLQTS
jgi:hypothetical protein